MAVGGLPVPAAWWPAPGQWRSRCTAGTCRRPAPGGCDGAGHRGAPIPAALATRMLRLGPLLVAGREGLFAVPVEVPAQASPGDRLVGYLGRRHAWTP